jgi:hypothetical protein
MEEAMRDSVFRRRSAFEDSQRRDTTGTRTSGDGKLPLPAQVQPPSNKYADFEKGSTEV